MAGSSAERLLAGFGTHLVDAFPELGVGFEKANQLAGSQSEGRRRIADPRAVLLEDVEQFRDNKGKIIVTSADTQTAIGRPVPGDGWNVGAFGIGDAAHMKCNGLAHAFKRAGLVDVLGSFFGRGNDQSGGLMAESDGGAGLVAFLAAGTVGAISIQFTLRE